MLISNNLLVMVDIVAMANSPLVVAKCSSVASSRVLVVEIEEILKPWTGCL